MKTTKMLIMKKGQNWSIDAIVAVGIFVIALMFFLWNSGIFNQNQKVQDIGKEGDSALAKIDADKTNSPATFVTENSIDEKKLQAVSSLDYETLKSELGLKSDFCIHIEDENGNILNVSGSQVGIGSPRAVIGGTKCGQGS